MLLWARKEATKHMLRVHADGTEQCLVSFGSDTVSTWMFWMEEPSAFHTAYNRASILSLFCALANPHHAGDAYMALDRVVAWATRWRVCR